MEENAEEVLALKQQLAEQRLAERIDAISYKLYSLSEKLEKSSIQGNETLEQQVTALKAELEFQKKRNEDLFKVLTEELRSNGRRETGLLIRERYSDFWERLLFRNIYLSPKMVFAVSPFVPVSSFSEYVVNGYGDKIHFFAFGICGSSLFVEVMAEGKSISKKILFQKNGEYIIDVAYIKGMAVIRFHTNSTESIIRIVTFKKEKSVLKKEYIAAYVD